MRARWHVVGLVGLALVATVGGCRDAYPHSFTIAPGDVERMHGEPAEGGYYTNWDPYAATIELTPERDVNPVRTQHVLIATVKDHEGKPLPNRRVEWLVSEGSVGSIVEVDESGWRSSRGHKLTNTFAVTHTNNGDHVLTRGTDDPSDDVHLKRGQTWAVITSPTEGTTHVIAYAPGIYNWEKHKVFAQKHWYDVAWKLPPAATNRIGTDHVFKTQVMKHSDGSPLAGYEVTYKVLNGPGAAFDPDGGTAVTTHTNKNGVATATLKQTKPVAGTNNVEVTITRPANKQCCKPAALIHVGKTSKTWLAPGIAIAKTAPARAVKGQTFAYGMTVSNPAKVEARNVTVTDVLPDGIAYVSSSPQAKADGQKLTWSLGTLAAGARRSLAVKVKGTRTGTFKNCADVTAADGLKDRACASTIIAEPKIELVKDGPAEVILCDTITYTMTVRNTGGATAQNVRIVDKLPEGMTMTDGRDEAVFDLGSLKAGETKMGKLTAKASKKGTYTNTATVTADGGLKATDTAKTVVRQPVLVLTKKAPKMRYVGRNVTYTITVKNTGDAPAKNTVLTDTLPDGVQLLDAGRGKAAGRTITWSLGTLKPGASTDVTVRVKAVQKGTLRNVASVQAFCAKDSGEAVTKVQGIAAILLECVDLADPIEVGKQETYVITVTNQGSAMGTNIVIKCTAPAEQDVVSTNGPTKAQVEGKTVTFAPLKSLAPKAKATYRVVTKGLKPGDTRFEVTLTSDQMKTPAGETESTHIYSDAE